MPKNYIDIFLKFQKNIIIYRKVHLINNNSFDRLINVDETPLYMEMPSQKTIELKGTKDIEVTTFGGEKERISLILVIAGNGGKLPPILIFKAKKGGNLEKTLNQYLL